jgi:hypothetical protein
MATSARKPNGIKRPRKPAEKPCQVFSDARAFITRYAALDDAEADLVTIWALGTWTFSPMCQWPATYPLLYIAGEAGAGKTVLGQDALSICREWKSATGTTGATLFRMQGREDEETGEIENFAPTLVIDEIDSTFAGSKDEDLRRALNVSYKRGATIPRSAGKSSIDFPIYGPKIMMGIDNGHLPETVTQRSIRIDVRKRTMDELVGLGIEPFYTFDVEDEQEDLKQAMRDWAVENSMVLRDYRPKAPEGLTARQWEISRTMVQLAHACGIENRIIDALLDVFSRSRRQESAKQRLYVAIAEVFEMTGQTKVTSRAIMKHLNEKGIGVPGNSMTGLGHLLARDGIQPKPIWISDPNHPDFKPGKNGLGASARGYQRYQFDQAFVDYLPAEDADEDA